MSHLHLVPTSKPRFPFDFDLFALGKIGDAIVIAHNGKAELALPGMAGFEALKKWIIELEALAESHEPLPWPMPKGAAR